MLTRSLTRLRELLPWETPRPVVSVVRLYGVISPSGRVTPSLSLRALAPVFDRAFEGKNLKAVALLINSPGGSAAQSMLIFRRLRALAQEKEVPVYAFAEDAAASGGYLIACAADEIFASESSIVGSVGVVAATFGFHELVKRLGIERRVYTAGSEKTLLDPFKPVDPADVERLSAVQGDIHDAFKAIVRERRGVRLKGPETELFSGAFWTGRQGVTLGLIDGIGDLRTEMRRRYGKNVRFRVIPPERPYGRLARLTARSDAPPGLSDLGLADLLGAAAPGAVRDIFAALEERAWWNRLGL